MQSSSPAAPQAGREPPDDFDVLAAVWVLACNDENPLLTYEGIRHRLGLPATYDIHALIRSRRDLFRPGSAQPPLEEWRDDMLQGRRIPRWLTELGPERTRLFIAELSGKDVFRSQFRVETGAPKSSLEVLTWGIEHIERLRTLHERRREARRQWVTAFVIPLVTTLVAMATLVTTIYFQARTIDQQTELKRYEVTFKPKQEGYAQFMRQAYSAYRTATTGDRAETVVRLNELESTFHALEPFVDADARDELWRLFRGYADFCLGVSDQARGGTVTVPIHDREIALRRQFATRLYAALFDEEQQRKLRRAAD